MTYAQQMRRQTEVVNKVMAMAMKDRKLALSILDRLGITEEVVKKKSKKKKK